MEYIKEIYTKYVGENRFYFFVKLLLTLFFSITITLDKMLVFNGDLFSKINESYFLDLKPQHVLFFFIIWIITFIITTVIEKGVDKLEGNIYNKQQERKSIKIFFAIPVVLILLWLPYILSYFPGGLYIDTMSSIWQAIGWQELHNQHPLLYTLIIKTFVLVFGVEVALKFFSIAQVIAMSTIISGFIYWLYRKNIRYIYIVLVTLFFGIFNLIPLYAVSIWKDVPFCLALFLLVLLIAEIVYQNSRNIKYKKTILFYAIVITLVNFFRNNGIHITIVVTLMLFLIYRKNVKMKWFMIISGAVIAISIFVQGYVFNRLDLNITGTNTISVPLQQVAYVVATDGNLTDEQVDFINEMCHVETIKELYCPMVVDSLKDPSIFNDKFLHKNQTEFLKLWFQIFLQNPKAYIEAYLLNTLGFWDVNKSHMTAYISAENWGLPSELTISEQKDYIQRVTGLSIRENITPTKAISSAVFLFILLFSMLITIYKKRYKNLLIYMPALLTWLTIMVATPLAFSLRYVYILVLMVPFSALIPFLKTKEENAIDLIK